MSNASKCWMFKSMMDIKLHQTELQKGIGHQKDDEKRKKKIEDEIKNNKLK